MIDCLYMGHVAFNSFASHPRQAIANAMVAIYGISGNIGNINLFDSDGNPTNFPSAVTDSYGNFFMTFSIDPLHLVDVAERIPFQFGVSEWDNELKLTNRSRFRLQRFTGNLLPVLNWRNVANGGLPDLRNPASAVSFAADLYSIGRGFSRFRPPIPRIGTPSAEFFKSFSSRRVDIRE